MVLTTTSMNIQSIFMGFRRVPASGDYLEQHKSIALCKPGLVIKGSGSRVSRCTCRVYANGFWVQGLGSRTQFPVHGSSVSECMRRHSSATTGCCMAQPKGPFQPGRGSANRTRKRFISKERNSKTQEIWASLDRQKNSRLKAPPASPNGEADPKAPRQSAR